MPKTPVLGRYQILKELGRGAMGRVFLALDPDIQRKVAIKTIQVFASLPESERGEARERFTREARSAGKLLHPGIVTLFDVGEHKGIPFLAMEYVQGTPLDRHCRKGELLPVGQVLEIIRQAAVALDYAHEAGIVHRDVKPSNLMLVGGSTLKIMDFGLAKAPATQLTSDGTLLGTPGYMSPEQIRGGMVDGRADLFSLACVLYEMLTGQKPFDGDSISSVVYRVVHEDPPDPAGLGDRVSPDLAAFLIKALSKDPAGRPASGHEFADLLMPFLEAGKASAPRPDDLLTGGPGGRTDAPVELPPPTHARARRKRGAGKKPFGILVLVLLAALGAGGWYFRADLKVLWQDWAASRRDGRAGEALFYEATVRTEPAGLTVFMDGEPLQGDQVRFPAEPPYGNLSSELECRTVVHPLDVLDAGGEIELVLDPVRLELALPVPVEGAAVRINGGQQAAVPESVEMNLCRENRIEFLAAGYYPLEVTLPAAATPLEARTLLTSVAMERIPTGTLLLPDPGYPLDVRIDGKRRKTEGSRMEIEAGEHRVRITNERYWIDQTAHVTIRAGEPSRPIQSLPPLADLSVLAYPPNCRVLLRKGRGDSWKFLKNTPLAGYKIAAGDYHLRVELVSTGDVRDQDIRLRAGSNPPVRVSFGGS